MPGISLVPRTVTDDHNCLKWEGFFHESVKGIFPMRGEGHNRLKFNAEAISQSKKVVEVTQY